MRRRKSTPTDSRRVSEFVQHTLVQQECPAINLAHIE
jgi:hypothetical protein